MAAAKKKAKGGGIRWVQVALFSPALLVLGLLLYHHLFISSLSTSIISSIPSSLPFLFHAYPTHTYYTYQVCSPRVPITLPSINHTHVANVIHASPTPSASPTGSSDAPFSLDAALSSLAALRLAKPSEPLTLVLHPGSYQRMNSLLLTSAHSGTATGPSVITSLDPSQPASLSGGFELPSSCFQPLTASPAAVSQRLPSHVLDHLIAVDLVSCLGLTLPMPNLTSFGFSEPVLPSYPQLYMDHTPLTLARWPNSDEGWLRTGAVIERGSVPREGNFSKLGFTVQLTDDVQRRVSSWKGSGPDGLTSADGVWMMGYWTYDWAEQAVQVASLARGAVTSRHASHYGVKEGARYHFFNVPDELDSPGEYFISDGWLWLYPPHGYVSEAAQDNAEKAQRLFGLASSSSSSSSLSPSHLYLSLSAHPLITFKGASHIRLQDVTVELTRGSGIRILDSHDLTLDSLTIRRIGNVGLVCGSGAPLQPQYMAGDLPPDVDDADVVVGDMGQGIYHKNFVDPLWNRQCGSCITVSHTHMHSLGAGGVIMGGGDRVTLTPGHNLLSNLHIHSFSLLWSTYRPAVWLEGVGNALIHSIVSNGPHTAVLLNGNDHTVEFNDISAVCQDTADVGVIYTGRDWTQRGHQIRYNFIHHISALVPTAPAIKGGNVTFTSVGTDASGVYFDDLSSGSTVAHNVFYRIHRAVLLGGGRDHTIVDNLIIQAETPIHFDARAITSHKSLVNPQSVLFRRLEATPVHSKEWTQRYPSLAGLKNREPERPAGNIIERNVLVGCGRMWVAREVERGVGLNWAGGREWQGGDGADHWLVQVRTAKGNVTFVDDQRVVSVRDRLYRDVKGDGVRTLADEGESGREGHRHVSFERCEQSTWLKAEDVVVDYEHMEAVGWSLDPIPVGQIGPCCVRGQSDTADRAPSHHDGRRIDR